MSRRVITLIIVLVVLVGLVGAYIAVTRPKPVKTANTPPQLINVDKDKLVKITLTDRKEGTLTLEKKGKTWSVDPATPYALDPSNIDDIVLTFTTLTAERMIDENPTNLGQYGLDPPRAVGEAFYSDGTTKTLLLGDKTPEGSTYYLRVKGDPRVYTVWQNHGEEMHWKLADLRDKTITPSISYDQLTYFRLSEPGKPVIELRKKTDKERKIYQLGFSDFLMLRPYSYPCGVNAEKQDQLIKGPQQITIESFVNDHPTDLAPYGLARPRAEVVVRDTKNSIDFLIGKEAGKDTTYFMIRGQPGVYTTLTSSLSFLDTKPWDIVDRFVFIPNIDDVDRIDITSREGAHTLAITRVVTKKAQKPGEKDTVEATYTVDGKKAEEDSFKAFYQQLIGMQVEGEVAHQVPEVPDVRVRFYLNKGPSKEVTITYAPYDRDFDAVFVNGKCNFALTRQQLGTTLTKLAALAAGQKVTY